MSILASAVLWGFIIYCLIEEKTATEEFGEWQSWITQNFTWFYIGTQDVWTVFLLWLLFSKYASLKLGKDDEKPEFSDVTWFSMLFAYAPSAHGLIVQRAALLAAPCCFRGDHRARPSDRV